MNQTVTSIPELGNTLKDPPDEITIKGDLRNAVVEIKGTGQIGWALAIASIGIAFSMFVGSGGSAVVLAVAVAGTAVAVIGYQATKFALTLALSAASLTVLSTLRTYKLKEIGMDFISLKWPEGVSKPNARPNDDRA